MKALKVAAARDMESALHNVQSMESDVTAAMKREQMAAEADKAAAQAAEDKCRRAEIAAKEKRDRDVAELTVKVRSLDQ
jgi:hypothetical protein